MIVYPVAILFGCHDNIKFLKKDFFKMTKPLSAVWL